MNSHKKRKLENNNENYNYNNDRLENVLFQL